MLDIWCLQDRLGNVDLDQASLLPASVINLDGGAARSAGVDFPSGGV